MIYLTHTDILLIAAKIKKHETGGKREKVIFSLFSDDIILYAGKSSLLAVTIIVMLWYKKLTHKISFVFIV